MGNKELGNWPPKSKIRRIDGVIILDELKNEKPKVSGIEIIVLKNFIKRCREKQLN